MFCSSCVLSEKCFVIFHVFSFPTGVDVGTFNLIALISSPSILFFFRYGHAVNTGIDYYRTFSGRHFVM